MPDASSPEAMRTVSTLVQAARMLPGADSDRVGIFGHSRGGGAALNYMLKQGDVQAVVLNSTGYPGQLANFASEAKVPILMLHGTADNPEDGGSAATNIQMARDFEATLRGAGKHVEAVYYEGGRHNSIFTNSTQCDDEVQQMLTFLLRHLRS